MLGPRAVQHLQMPHPRDWQGGQMPRSCPAGGWAQVELTDALLMVNQPLIDAFVFYPFHETKTNNNWAASYEWNDYTKERKKERKLEI